MTVAPEDLCDSDYWARPPSPASRQAREKASAIHGKVVDVAQLEPVVEFLQAIKRFLAGEKWPDGGLVENGLQLSTNAAVSRACRCAFGEDDSAIYIPPSIETRRLQSVARDSGMLDVLFILLRSYRKSNISNHLLFIEPPLLMLINFLESAIVLATESNARSQLAIACSRYSGHRRLHSFEVCPGDFPIA